ncbi:PD40 domain-containing protein [Rhodothermus marinus]|uniref:PD40 domain-containing protein n=2 Tax=Rhodothermus marinus TaxID=29549 RepID=UPI00137518F1|nr:PD40 domain-containing protein [Rhodothermus marinus]
MRRTAQTLGVPGQAETSHSVARGFPERLSGRVFPQLRRTGPLSLLMLMLWMSGGCDLLRSEKEEFIIPIKPVFDFTIDMYPAWGPDSRTIAYTHRPQTPEEAAFGRGDQIWLLDIETGRRCFLTLGWKPAWSPDGRRIAFIYGAYEAANLYVVEVLSGEVTELTTEGASFNPSWSPDGKRILYDRGGYYYEIWVMNADGSNKRKITRGQTPSWSPDGSSIAYVTFFEDTSRGHVDELVIMDTSGQHVRRLTFDIRQEDYPSWSPDGMWIIYRSIAEGVDPTNGLWMIHTISKRRRFLVQGAHASWSPDGRQIVYDGPYGENSGTIWIMNADGSNRHPLTRPEDYQPGRPVAYCPEVLPWHDN